MSKSCWSCGHYVLGGLCFKNPDGSSTVVKFDDTCSDWVSEDTKGTVNDISNLEENGE